MKRVKPSLIEPTGTGPVAKPQTIPTAIEKPGGTGPIGHKETIEGHTP